MADQRLSDEEIQLRQKARQRLIGAVTLMMAAVVVLPWALDGKPKVHTHEIAVYLPASAPSSNEPAASSPAAPAASAAVTASPSPARAATQPGTAAPAPGAEAKVAVTPATVEPPQPPVAERVEPPAAAAKAAPTVHAHPAEGVQTAHAHPAKPMQKAHAHPRQDAAETQPGAAATHDAAAADRPASQPVTGGYVLQLGTFSEADNARQLKARLAAKGVPAFTERLASPGGDRIRVRVGPYPNRAAAEQALSRVNALGLSGVVLNAR